MTAAADLPRRVAVLGFARSGRALACALLDRGIEVAVGDRRPAADFPERRELEGRGARFFFDGPPESFADDAAWLAVSPGVPLNAPAVVRARQRGLPVLGEFEIAWRIAQAEVQGENRWVAVTGTNGKSTTTAWIAHILRRAGRPVALAGNIGVPLSSFLADRSPRDFVCELSSFQLETMERFRPDVAVLTNITPDHLDRYARLEDYAAAKLRIFENQTERDAAVVNADDEGSRSARPRSRRVPFSRSSPQPGGAWAAEGWVHSAVAGPAKRVMRCDRLALAGAHNLENALAALATAEWLGTPDTAVRQGLADFEGLPHRTELVAEAGGVRWVNDSKGTNVDATRKSLQGLPAERVLLILGGRDKHGDFSLLAPEVSHAVRRIFTIGEAASAVEKALAGSVPIEQSGTMERAVARAAELARSGDTVLLSPACASFDQYANFEERGAHFTRLAREAAAAATRLHGS
jgi:UDP-N-acetylmuramoylalanine--D-glutamate ligase